MDIENLMNNDDIAKLSQTKALDLAQKIAADICKSDTRNAMSSAGAEKIFFLIEESYISFWDAFRLAKDFGHIFDRLEPPSEKDIEDCIMQYLTVDDGERDTLSDDDGERDTLSDDDGERDTLSEYSLSDVVKSLKDIKALLIDIRDGLKWLRVEG